MLTNQPQPMVVGDSRCCQVDNHGSWRQSVPSPNAQKARRLFRRRGPETSRVGEIYLGAASAFREQNIFFVLMVGRLPETAHARTGPSRYRANRGIFYAHRS
jgi:hypothetical protein